MTPTASQVLAARIRAGLSQSQAARLVGLSSRNRFSEYENGRVQMSGQTWELFLIKTGQMPVPHFTIKDK
jgi:transcriptional regulator with XRE-family HTH domain